MWYGPGQRRDEVEMRWWRLGSRGSGRVDEGRSAYGPAVCSISACRSPMGVMKPVDSVWKSCIISAGGCIIRIIRIIVAVLSLVWYRGCVVDMEI